MDTACVADEEFFPKASIAGLAVVIHQLMVIAMVRVSTFVAFENRVIIVS